MTTPANAARRTFYSILRPVMILLALLYLFFLGLEMMGLAFKLFGRGFAEMLIETTANPFVGLFVGILATTAVQSSSTTTSMTVALVAGGALTIEGAIPIIMGANIGTTVTNTLVSLAHVTRTEEFRRAFAGATIHDFFNWLAVAILLPVELFTGYLATVAAAGTRALEGVGGIKLFNPLRAVVRPMADLLSETLGSSGVVTLLFGVLLTFVALRFLVVLLRKLLSEKAERVLHGTLFRSAAAAITAGLVMTVMVQSSSITTSVMVPLLGAGVVTLKQVFPFFLGANVGTTVTAMLAALETGSPPAVTVALAHLAFNVTGGIVIYGFPPARALVIWSAERMGDLAVRSRVLAVVYVAAGFFLIPLLLLFAAGALS